MDENHFDNMRQIGLFVFILCFLATGACKKEQATETKDQPSNIKKVDKTPVKVTLDKTDEKNAKPADSINKKNAVAFLTKYGELNSENRVRIKTRLGDMVIQLYDDTPLHRANFIFLTKMKYFDTTCFYRVVPDFIIQGGESERLDTQRFKARYHRYKIPPEFRENRKHKYGAVALARDWENNPAKYSTAFEFYIIQNRKGAHHLNNEHTVFGEVISGFETIDKIVNLKTGSDEWPLEDVFMKIEVY